MAADHRPNATLRNNALITVVVAVTVLYFARSVLIPFALATLFSFLLNPLVSRLRRWGLGRIPSVFIVVMLAILIATTVGTLVSVQLADLAHKLPQYQQNIRDKVQSIQASSRGTISRLTRVIHDFSVELTPPPQPKSQPGEEKPVPVEIRRSPFTPLEIVPQILGSLFNILLMTGIVTVFVLFMLFQREDLRDRLIRLVGAGRINITTQALDDAAQRVSRYLIAQLMINVAFGVLAGTGLYFLNVPNPILWGVLAGIFRYVPYLGIWVAAIMPATVALAISPEWWEPLEIFALYLGIDLLIYNLVEPLLYGNSTGISPLAIMAAAVFWTWLWGAIGLLLSTPLTVCLVVIGRYVPSLEFLSILLGDDAVLGPEKRFYQRLLAMDAEEAAEVAQEFLRANKSLEDVFDKVIIPALSLAEEDRHRGKLDDSRQQFILQNARAIVDDLAERADEIMAEKPARGKAAESETPCREPVAVSEVAVLSIPARDEADEISALMLTHLLTRRGVGVKTISASALASERLEEASREKIQSVCISAIPPFGYMHARYLCKLLRAQFPDVKVVAAILNQGDAQELKKREPPLAADEIATSIRQAVAEILSLVVHVREPSPEPALSS